VACRLEFMSDYMMALVELSDKGTAAKSKSNGKAATPEARLTNSLRLLERLEATAIAASPKVLSSFDASFNRKLLVPGPPRTVEPITDSQVVYRMWTSHVHELLLCGSLANRQLDDLLRGAVTYKDQPNVLPRSFAQIRASEQGFVRRLLLASLEQHLFPLEALQHCKKPSDIFLTRCESMFLHMLKLSHSNNARKFRRLAHVFPDFNELQHEAWQLDDALQKTFGANLQYQRPCWVWIMEQCLQAMIAKLLLGFQLELYDEAEFHMIYWYVDYLYGLRIYNLNDVYFAKEQGAAGAKKKPGGGRKDQTTGTKPRNPPASLLMLEATQSAIRGMFRILAFCLSRGLLSVPAAAMEGLPQAFVLRFRCLELFRLPHLPSYKDFESSVSVVQVPLETRSVLTASQTSFSEAGKLLDRIAAMAKEGGTADVYSDAVKSIKRVIVANQLAASQLLKSLDVGEDLGSCKKVLVERVHHAHLVSLQVLAK